MSVNIGFFGCESYDIQHYLSRVLCCLGKKVILLDGNRDGALKSSIPLPETFPEDEVFDYRGVDYAPVTADIDESYYDCVFFDLSQDMLETMEPGDIGDLFHTFILVSDLQTHHMNQMIQFIKSNLIDTSRIFLIIRDLSGNRKKRMIQRMTDLPADQIYYLQVDQTSERQRLSCQWNHVFSFRKIDVDLRSALQDILIKRCSIEENKEFKTAYKRAERGK
ncbi:MAG: hypothetical protein MSA09_06005 [Lachnospiraceae bacterium]|nr:hypothetical protein [Lachnospiraceae bacterium]